MINLVQLTKNMTNSERRSKSVPRETSRQDQITPDHVTVASVSLSPLLKAKICSRNSKTSMDEIFIGTYSYAWYRYPYLWYQVPPHLHNIEPGTTPLVPWYHYPVIPPPLTSNGATTFCACPVLD